MIDENSKSGFYHFLFPLVDEHSKKSYRYFFLSWNADGRIGVGAADGDRYLNGSAYIDHQPLQSHQLTFQLTYEWTMVIRDVVKFIIDSLYVTIISLFTLLLPGYTVLAWLYKSNLNWLRRVSLAAGLGVAIYSIIVLWLSLFGIKLGNAFVFILLSICIILIVYHYRLWRIRSFIYKLNSIYKLDALLVFLVLIIVIFLNRLLVIRPLPAPMWGDSYQHAVVTQLIIDNRGLFSSWRPYADYNTFTVHFGFSAVSAVLGWALGSSDGTFVTMLSGQLMNGLAVLALYALADVLFPQRSPWIGIFAVLVGGLVLPMPAYYTNWGRYAQLSGQVVLPVALALITEGYQRNNMNSKQFLSLALLVGICIGGATLHYYRMPFYIAAYIVSLILIEIKRAVKTRTLVPKLLFLLLSVISGIIIISPRYTNMFNSSLLYNSQLVVSFDYNLLVQSVIKDYEAWLYINTFVPTSILIIFLISSILILVRKERSALILFLWIALLFILPALRLIRFFGSNLVQSFATIIALYIPFSIIISWLVCILKDRLMSALRIILFTGATVLFFLNQLYILNSNNFALVTYPDIRAIEWLRDNTPPDSLFLVQGYTIYDGQSIVGSDAGWWLPLLSGRSNVIPPQYAILNEQSIEDGYSLKLINLIKTIEEKSINAPEARQMICEFGITHVFSGQRQGRVGADVRQLFSPAYLYQIKGLTPVYQRDRVIILALNENFCRP